MAQCEVCGNDYYLSFEVVTAGNRHVFDCFECAIHKLARRRALRVQNYRSRYRGERDVFLQCQLRQTSRSRRRS